MYVDPGLADEIRSLVTETLLVNVESADTDLLATGLLDSLRLIDLLTQLEHSRVCRGTCSMNWRARGDPKLWSPRKVWITGREGEYRQQD
jgi:hypothetical protein